MVGTLVFRGFPSLTPALRIVSGLIDLGLDTGETLELFDPPTRIFRLPPDERLPVAIFPPFPTPDDLKLLEGVVPAPPVNAEDNVDAALAY
jgi:hypothetical protein